MYLLFFQRDQLVYNIVLQVLECLVKFYPGNAILELH